MHVDRGGMFYGVRIHFVSLVCLFVILPMRLSVFLFICLSSTVCSSACWTCRSSIWLFEFFFFFSCFHICLILIFSILISHTQSSCLSRSSPASKSLTCQSLLTVLSLLSVFFICCSQSRSLTCTSFFPPLSFSFSRQSQHQPAIMPVNCLRGSGLLITNSLQSGEKNNRCQWGGSKFCCFIPAVLESVNGGR